MENNLSIVQKVKTNQSDEQSYYSNGSNNNSSVESYNIDSNQLSLVDGKLRNEIVNRKMAGKSTNVKIAEFFLDDSFNFLEKEKYIEGDYTIYNIAHHMGGKTDWSFSNALVNILYDKNCECYRENLAENKNGIEREKELDSIYDTYVLHCDHYSVIKITHNGETYKFIINDNNANRVTRIEKMENPKSDKVERSIIFYDNSYKFGLSGSKSNKISDSKYAFQNAEANKKKKTYENFTCDSGEHIELVSGDKKTLLYKIQIDDTNEYAYLIYYFNGDYSDNNITGTAIIYPDGNILYYDNPLSFENTGRVQKYDVQKNYLASEEEQDTTIYNYYNNLYDTTDSVKVKKIDTYLNDLSEEDIKKYEDKLESRIIGDNGYVDTEIDGKMFFNIKDEICFVSDGKTIVRVFKRNPDGTFTYLGRGFITVDDYNSDIMCYYSGDGQIYYAFTEGFEFKENYFYIEIDENEYVVHVDKDNNIKVTDKSGNIVNLSDNEMSEIRSKASSLLDINNNSNSDNNYNKRTVSNFGENTTWDMRNTLDMCLSNSYWDKGYSNGKPYWRTGEYVYIYEDYDSFVCVLGDKEYNIPKNINLSDLEQVDQDRWKINDHMYVKKRFDDAYVLIIEEFGIEIELN